MQVLLSDDWQHLVVTLVQPLVVLSVLSTEQEGLDASIMIFNRSLWLWADESPLEQALASMNTMAIENSFFMITSVLNQYTAMLQSPGHESWFFWLALKKISAINDLDGRISAPHQVAIHIQRIDPQTATLRARGRLEESGAFENRRGGGPGTDCGAHYIERC